MRRANHLKRTAAAVRARLSAMEYNIPAFARRRDAFCRDNRGPALIKSGQRRRLPVSLCRAADAPLCPAAGRCGRAD